MIYSKPHCYAIKPITLFALFPKQKDYKIIKEFFCYFPKKIKEIK